MRYLKSGDCIYNLHDFPWQKIIMSPKVRDRHKTEYYNIPCAFDIETTNIPPKIRTWQDAKAREKKEVIEKAYAFMYCWQLCIDRYVLFGRTWEEYITTMDMLSVKLGLGDGCHLVIYVHNLAYEFQFVHDFQKIVSMFARKERKPIKYVEERGIEWRCSYMLSNMSLAKFCENSRAVTHGKIVGEYDYEKIRTPYAELTDTEDQYRYNDVYGLCECIRDRLTEDNIVTIPLTSTGYVRREFRKAVLSNTENRKVFKKTRPSTECYTLLKEAFSGGNTHANYRKVGYTIEHVRSYDITSSYPGVMLRKKFPMSFIKIRDSKWGEYYRNGEALLFRVRWRGLIYKRQAGIPYISISKGRQRSGVVNDNGRVLRADTFEMTLTDLDFKIIASMYDWQEMYVHDVYTAHYDYLPIEFRQTLYKYFEQKTMLKGTEHEYEYMKSKNRINSAYGMMVTDIIAPEIIYQNGVWSEKPVSVEHAIADYYNNKNSFLAYQWGVWVTAWARTELQKGIDACGRDIIYVDTDSIKTTKDVSMEIERINAEVIEETESTGMKGSVEHNGKIYYMGTWDYEGTYDEFRTLGAKKYVVKENGKYKTTVAGLSKIVGAQYINEHGIESFAIGTVFKKCGNLTATYNDETIHEITIDEHTFLTASNLALIDSDYTLGVTQEYWELFGENLKKYE